MIRNRTTVFASLNVKRVSAQRTCPTFRISRLQNLTSTRGLARSRWPQPTRSRQGSQGVRVACSIFDDIDRGSLPSVRTRFNMKPSIVEERAERTGHTPLMVAAVRGDIQIMKFLLDNGAKVSTPDKSGWTALHFAVLKDQEEATRLLLAYGADPRAATRTDEPSLVRMAHSKGVAKLLLDALEGKRPSKDQTFEKKPAEPSSEEEDDQKSSPVPKTPPKPDLDKDALLANINDLLVEPKDVKVSWDQVAGLTEIKQDLEVNLLGALQRPELFTGMLQPAHGILFFGPPGTGKTLLAKAIAKKCGARFYSLSASSLASKYVGDSEKLVKLLFDQAIENQPSIIFFDEIDSVLRSRASGEEEWVRKVKNEFLVRLQEIQEGGTVYFIGASNTPADLDEAVLRRLERRFYIPLPDPPARHKIITDMATKNKNTVPADAWWNITLLTDGYSAADLRTICAQAARRPLQEAFQKQGGFQDIDVEQLRPITVEDYMEAVRIVRPSVSQATVEAMRAWGDERATDL